MSAAKDAKFFECLYELARNAGMGAALGAKPVPMFVSQPSDPLNDNSVPKAMWYVPEGVCGFAWINVRPGFSSFAKWLVKNGKARAAYSGGVDIWVSEFGQSMDRKEAYAHAFAKVLSDAGVNAYASSRMD